MKAISIVAMLVTLAGISISVLGRGEHHKVSLRLPLNGVLFAMGAAICQGVGLVLSKIGMNHFEAVEGVPEWLVPFSANFYRCIAGLVGFSLLHYFRDGIRPLRDALHDRKGLSAATATTIFGPFMGVGFSLMAVQYTAAGIASTLMALTPIIILLPSRWFFHQKITWRAVVGAVISVLGVSLFFLG
jgi:drug/metabolite transporter (DMT)-like permease